VSFWNKQAGRFLQVSSSSLTGSASRQQLDWAGLEDEISFFVVAAGDGVALYNAKTHRFLQITDQGIGLSEPMNWEHVSKLNLTSSFKAFGSDDGHMGSGTAQRDSF